MLLLNTAVKCFIGEVTGIIQHDHGSGQLGIVLLEIHHHLSTFSKLR